VRDSRSAAGLPDASVGTFSHPTPESRLSHVRDFAAQHVPDALTWGDSITRWFEVTTPGVVAAAARNSRQFRKGTL